MRSGTSADTLEIRGPGALVLINTHDSTLRHGAAGIPDKDGEINRIQRNQGGARAGENPASAACVEALV